MNLRENVLGKEEDWQEKAVGCQYHDIKKGELLLGFAAFLIEKRCILLKQLVVHCGYRGQGIGTDLVKYVESRGRNTGKLFVEIVVSEESKGLGWLKDRGYFAQGLILGAFGTRDGVRFRKML